MARLKRATVTDEPTLTMIERVMKRDGESMASVTLRQLVREAVRARERAEEAARQPAAQIPA